MQASKLSLRIRVCAIPLLSLLCAAQLLAAGKAYLFVGVESDAKEQKRNDDTATIAKKQYEKRGWTVVIVNNPAKQSFLDALNDTSTGCIWFVGHGVRLKSDGYVPELAYNLQTKDRISAGDFQQGDATKKYPNLKSVVFHACGQDLDDWKNLFPNAYFSSSPSAMNPEGIRTKQVNWEPDFIPAAPNNRNNQILTTTDGTWAVDSRIVAAAPVEDFDADHTTEGNRTTTAAYGWQMPPALASAFGNLRFNMTSLDEDGLVVPLDGVGVFDGHVSEQADDYALSDADFTIYLSPDAFRLGTANIDSLNDAYLAGDIQIQNNTTGIGDATLFQGAACVTFGLNSVPEPATALVTLPLIFGLAARRAR